ncbi:MAG TPA: RidA family protein [Pseudomonadales bacterium]|nr:RidA family protein [Pseudomonadales bacterium]
MTGIKKIGADVILPNGNIAPLASAYAAGGLFFSSGMLAFDSQNQLVSGDVGMQTTVCLENLARILASEGLSKEQIVKVTVWLTDVADFAAFNAAYVAFFGNHRPARSTTRADLMLPEAKVEIEIIAAY